MGEYEKATDYLAQALDLALRNNQRTGTLYCNLGLCHNVMGDNDKALHHYHLGIKRNFVRSVIEIVKRYTSAISPIFYTIQKRYTEAASLYEELLSLAVETGVRANECISRGNYGSLLIEMNKWDRAAEQLQKSIDIGTDIYPIAANVFQGMLAYLRS